MTKQQRQFHIREIITNEHITSQEEIHNLLKAQGLEINQATLSRDLSEMGVGRAATGKGPRYTFYEEKEESIQVRSMLSYEVRSINRNEAMIVIKTLSGRAQGVAEIIDSMESPFILGTIAGDNTIFIAPKAIKDLNRLVNELRGLITG
ncbi:MAG TPA: arginine repressor [Candidatus Kapabacteria bacterium]|jgi:transcriptional regulator of arginine metabolism